jgi:hypothetical protein
MAAACFTLAVTGLDADEVCDTGFRSPTPDEEAAMQAVLERALGTIPAQIEGWSASTNDALSVNSQCKDDAPEPWEYSFYRSFDRTDDREEREAMLKEAGTQYQAARQANQSSTDAIMARIQELSEAAMAAAQAGDYDKVDAINAEIQQASSQMAALMQGANADVDAASEEASRDMWIRIEVAVNPGWEQVGYESRPVAAPAGATHAFRWSDTSRGPGDETELVLFGSWRKDGDSYDQIARADVAQTVTQAMSVRVTADESRIESVLGAIDFAALARLVSR